MPNTRGPGFSIFLNATMMTVDLPATRRRISARLNLRRHPGAYQGVEPGDTIETHWVHTSCEATPGEGLGACVPEACSNPLLRVEAQVFLVVNDPDALDFATMTYGGNIVDGRHQAKDDSVDDRRAGVVSRLNDRAVIRSNANVRKARVTWNVRPRCAKLDINSLAPLGGARKCLQRNTDRTVFGSWLPPRSCFRRSTDPAVGACPRLGGPGRSLLFEGGALDQRVDALADGQPEVVRCGAGDA